MSSILISGLVGLFLPADCLLCKRPLEPLNRSFICCSCWQKVERLPPVYCKKCSKPLFFTPVPDCSFPDVCLDCKTKPPAFERLFSPTIYRGVVAEAIKFFKYKHKRGILRGFVDIVTSSLYRFNLGSLGLTAIVPVPLHPRKKRERGYNQADDIARILSKQLNIPVRNDYLLRIRYTKPQTSFKKDARRDNVRGAFFIPKKSRNLGVGADKKILLVDDVYTTGFTLNEATNEIKKYGAQVFSFTLARSV